MVSEWRYSDILQRALDNRLEDMQPEDLKDVINPDHYKSHPSGIECIEVIEHMDYNLASAIKYIWRCGQKGDAVEDLKKARWFIEREIKRLSPEK